MAKITTSKVSQVSAFGRTSFGERHVSATDWANGEGFDLSVHDGRTAQLISITHEEWDMIAACVSVLSVGGADDA